MIKIGQIMYWISKKKLVKNTDRIQKCPISRSFFVSILPPEATKFWLFGAWSVTIFLLNLDCDNCRELNLSALSIFYLSSSNSSLYPPFHYLYINIYIHIPCCTFLNVKFLLQKFLNEKKKKQRRQLVCYFSFFFFHSILCVLYEVIMRKKRTWLWEAGM